MRTEMAESIQSGYQHLKLFSAKPETKKVRNKNFQS